MTGRFLNPDAFVSTGQGLIGYNMFAYCGNNPVTRADDSGEGWHILIAAAISGTVSLVTSIFDTAVDKDKRELWGTDEWWKNALYIFSSTTIGSAEGALSALCPGASIPIGACYYGASKVVSIVIKAFWEAS